MPSKPRRRSPPCPECKSKRTAVIRYGYPSFNEQLQRELNAGTIALGGCVITGDDPDYLCHRCGYQWRKGGPPVTTFPIYVVDTHEGIEVLRPADHRDIGHTEFWEQEAAAATARAFGIAEHRILNLPYCQRRARVAGNKVYYGEDPDPKLLAAIRKALGKPKLEFVYDDHEKRLPFDVQAFEQAHALGDEEE